MATSIEKTMTLREFYSAIAAIETLPADLREYAETAGTKLDAANEAKRAKAAEARKAKASENAPLNEAILAFLANGAVQTTTAVATELGVHTSKASYLLRELVKAGTLEVKDVKVPGKGMQKGYFVSVGCTEDAE